jgi:hypothetical protein
VANWLKQHEEEVENLKAMELDALREACWMSKQQRIERFSARLEHIAAELDKRDFSDVPTVQLAALELKARAELAKEFSDDPIVRSESELRNAKIARAPYRVENPEPLLFSDYVPPRKVYDEDDITVLLEPEENGNERKRSGRESKR